MLVDYFRIDRDNVNIGLILYGKEPIAISWPQPTKDQTKTNTRISLLAQRESYARKLSGTTDVPGALRLMRHMFRNPSGYPLQQPRPSAKQIGIMFTYGTVPDYMTEDIIATANDFKEAGIDMYSVGRSPNGQWFNEIASHPCNVFSMDSYAEGLRGLLPYIGSSICTGNYNIFQYNRPFTHCRLWFYNYTFNKSKFH